MRKMGCYEQKTAGIILAAGASIRFGRPKQLARFQGKCLLERVLEAALLSDLDRIILVLGHAHFEVATHLKNHLCHPKLAAVLNRNYRLGQSSSLKIGLSVAKRNYPAVMFLLADQPFIQIDTINNIIKHFWRSHKGICVPVHHGIRGNPVVFSRKYYRRLMFLKGDCGARDLIRCYAQDVTEVELPNALGFKDIDTPADLAQLNSKKI